MTGRWTTIAVREEQAVLLKAIQLATGDANEKPTRLIHALLATHLKKRLKSFGFSKLLKDLSKAEGLTYDHLNFDEYR